MSKEVSAQDARFADRKRLGLCPFGLVLALAAHLIITAVAAIKAAHEPLYWGFFFGYAIMTAILGQKVAIEVRGGYIGRPHTQWDD